MSRQVEVTKEIDAPIDTVWRAITEAREIEQWFPAEVRITPGPNGAIWLSWGEGAEFESRIFHWEPNQRFGWASEYGGQRIATDFFLEAKGAKTIVRLVNSGFGDDPEWDDEFHMIEAGWQYFMAHLKVHVERHFGQRRVLAVNREQSERSKTDAYERIVRALGFTEPPSAPERFSVTTREGDALEGSIVALNPGLQMGLQIDNLNHAMLFVEMEGEKDRAKPAVWLSTYGLDETASGALASRMRRLYDTALA